MSSLMNTDGPRELTFRCFDTASQYQANLLFEGIALSTTLDTLVIFVPDTFDETLDVGTPLIQALRRNTSLKCLDLPTDVFRSTTELGGLFNVTSKETDIEYLMINNNYAPNLAIDGIPFETMANALCQEECSIKYLILACVAPTRRNDAGMTNDNVKNSSITSFIISNSPIDCSRIMETVGLFRSIVRLYIEQHINVSDLSALDPLLIGSNRTLRHLLLISNGIRTEDAIAFFRKLPQMKCLASLEMSRNGFNGSVDSWKDIAIDSISQNKSLECVDFGGNTSEFFSTICLPLSLNRGGRRALEGGDAPSVLNPNLWPRVLERATKLAYCDSKQDANVGFDNSEPIESTRVDVVFWLLREKMVGHCL